MRHSRCHGKRGGGVSGAAGSVCSLWHYWPNYPLTGWHSSGLNLLIPHWLQSESGGYDLETDPVALPFGIPQGSVLGLILFTMYTSPPGDLCMCHLVDFQLYADDQQVCLSFKPSHTNQTAQESCISHLEKCIEDFKNLDVLQTTQVKQTIKQNLCCSVQSRNSRRLITLQSGLAQKQSVLQSYAKPGLLHGLSYEECPPHQQANITTLSITLWYSFHQITHRWRYSPGWTTITLVFLAQPNTNWINFYGSKT